MATTLYPTPVNFVAGITMKDTSAPEENNMALHACNNTGNIIENRRTLAAFLNCCLEDFVCAHQTHSANFHKVTRADRGRGSDTMETAIKETDALYTFEPNLLLCCFTGDCVPLILYNEAAGLVGVIHSGWGGTVREITPKVLRQLIQVEHCNPQDIHIMIGPAISQKKFEVDRDVCDQFRALGYADEFICFQQRTGKYHIDNQLVVKRQCELQGIPPEQITAERVCTYTNADCFSHRRDKNCGRHLSFILRRE
ncbi:MAG: peptidoglycan editing factor PgeF [Eubacteriales bacterium]|nr:peptidoglycan editing factor PgeF [Eubacteriales bacterium]